MKDIFEVLKELKEGIANLGEKIEIDPEIDIAKYLQPIVDIKGVDNNRGDRTSAKKEKLRTLFEKYRNCQRCGLWQNRKHIVFGRGNPDAKLMFIGEAPGRQEDIKGQPFVGEAGNILTKIIKAMGLSREQVYITNVVKCRPPRNRDPQFEEIENCKEIVMQEIDIVKPEVICTLGRFSSRLLTGTNYALGRIHGQWFKYKDIDVIPTLHPAACLYNAKNKVVLWNDIKKLMARLNLPNEKSS